MKRMTLALALTASLLSVTSTAYALIDKSYSAIYYSDATYTTEVGEGGITCIRNNTWMSWGVRTPYYIKYEETACCFSHCLPPEGGGFNQVTPDRVRNEED